MTPRAPKGGLGEFKGGQFLPKALWEEQKALAKAQLPGEMSDLSKDVEFYVTVAETLGLVPSGIPLKLTLEQIEERMIVSLRKAYNRAFLLGKRSVGNLTEITQDERKELTKIRRDEYKYARKFLRDAKEQRGRLGLGERSAMYGNALKEAYWLGFVLGNQEAGRTITWEMGPTVEKCQDCVKYAEHGPYPVKTFIEEVLGKGHLPQSGSLTCVGIRCQCRLSEILP